MAHRQNNSATIYASAARTAAPTATTQLNEGGSGICVVLDATAAAATPSITLTISGVDELGVVHTLLAGAAVTGISNNVYWVFPGAPVTTNVSANKFLPRQYKITVAHGDTDSITYSVTASILR